jgi:hypothetical protein
MTTPSRPVLVSTIRDAAQRAVAAESLRPVAKRVGLSTMGLRAFLLGATPRRSTEEKLRTWYAALVLEKARAAAGTLLADLPEPRRAAAVQALMDGLEQIYRQRGERPPWWIAVLKEDGPDK